MKSDDLALREIIRKNLIKCRTEKNITQLELSKLVGKSSNAVASWEQGLSLPDVATLYKLSKIYEKNMEYFYE